MGVEKLSDTQVVHAGVTPDATSGAMLTPIIQSTAYKQYSVERYQESGYTYSRCANPTVSAVEAKVGAMEGTNDVPAVCFSSGMAALNAVVASFLKTGDHIIVTRCSYGGTNRALRVLWARQMGLELSYVDMTNLKEVEEHIKVGKTKMIISETPCNPVLEVQDLQAISDLCEKHRNKKAKMENEELKEGEGPSWKCLEGRILHVADTTLAPPTLMRALDLGVDVVLLSLTKYYCGHNMFIAGALVPREKELYELIKFKQNVLGSIITPQTAYGLLQTAKTMHLRVEKQSRNAMAIARFLESHPQVEWVRYPGLASHPQASVAAKQFTQGLYGGMVSFEVKGGKDAGRRVMNACSSPWTLAENLGAVESIMTCPSVFTHANMTKEDRMKAGITDGMIRLSVGIEDENDLINSLERAIAAA